MKQIIQLMACLFVTGIFQGSDQVQLLLTPRTKGCIMIGIKREIDRLCREIHSDSSMMTPDKLDEIMTLHAPAVVKPELRLLSQADGQLFVETKVSLSQIIGRYPAPRVSGEGLIFVRQYCLRPSDFVSHSNNKRYEEICAAVQASQHKLKP